MNTLIFQCFPKCKPILQFKCWAIALQYVFQHYNDWVIYSEAMFTMEFVEHMDQLVNCFIISKFQKVWRGYFIWFWPHEISWRQFPIYAKSYLAKWNSPTLYWRVANINQKLDSFVERTFLRMQFLFPYDKPPQPGLYRKLIFYHSWQSRQTWSSWCLWILCLLQASHVWSAPHAIRRQL